VVLGVGADVQLGGVVERQMQGALASDFDGSDGLAERGRTFRT
jgi:hypothetical protein